MRVLHVTPARFSEVRGGGERYAGELARAMSERAEVTVAGSAARAVRADIVHLHQIHTMGSDAATVLGRLTGARIFATDLGGGARFALSYHLPLRRLVRRFLAISEYAASFHRAAGEAVAVIGAGIDTARFSPGPGPKRREALFVGRLLPHKGIEDLIDAAGPDLPVRVVGSPLNPGFYEALRRMAEGRPVRFDTEVGDDGLVRAYREAAVTVLPSVARTRDGAAVEKSELLGQTLLESLACGTPVVCTRVGGMPEAVAGCAAAEVVPPSDPAALRAALLRRMDAPADGTSEARSHVLSRFRWEDVVARCLEEYSR